MGFMVTQRGVEANPEKIQALINMKPPTKPEEVHSLTGRVANLIRFISKATDKRMRGGLPTAQAIPWGTSLAQFTQEKGGALSLLGCFSNGSQLNSYERR